MSKEIELEIKIDKSGKVHVIPKGTEGTECLDIMKFLDKLNGAKNIQIDPTQDIKKNNMNIENIINKLN